MQTRKIAHLFLFICLLAGVLSLAGSSQSAAQNVNIENELLQKLTDGRKANFFVRMGDQADLSAAYDIKDWNARGEYVYKTLSEFAAVSQKPVIEYAKVRGLEYKSLIAGNSVAIWAGDLQAVQDLASITGVASLELERIIPLPEPILVEGDAPEGVAWGLQDTGADDVWADYGYTGSGIKVANIDTGVQWNHPALVNQFACPGNPSSSACWADPSNICGGSACDNNGHGTHTMGTMIGDDGGANQIGMAPGATWIACKGCESNSCSDFALEGCADWILAPGGKAANRPHIVNNSWGGGGGDNWYLAKVNAWRAAGIYPAFSAGNSGSGCNTLGSPGDYQESFGTAAHNSARTIASFSSRGPSAFGHTPYTKPNISAPGVSICSSVPTDKYSCSWSGTSMASPHSAGAVALIWSGCPSYLGQINQTFELLQRNADTPPAGNCGAPSDNEGNNTYGYGYLNVLAAIDECGGIPGTELVTNGSFETGDTLPAGWKKNGKSTNKDIRTNAEAHAGSYSYTMVGNGKAKKLKQTITRSGSAGEDFALTVWTKTDVAGKGGNFRVIAKFLAPAKDQAEIEKVAFKKVLDLTRGTHDWQRSRTTFTAEKPYGKIVIILEFGARKGTVWFDEASLTVN